MAFDCVIVDFSNTCGGSNIKVIKDKMPHARVIPFVGSYFQVIESVINDNRTSHFWLLSSKFDYSTFDFDVIPEQHQDHQIHVWNNAGQDEGDTFLVPAVYTRQSLKFLRDYKDINYHSYNLPYDFDCVETEYNLDTVIENLPSHSQLHSSQYLRYHAGTEYQAVYPSYWEDLKVYRYKNDFYIPGRALETIKSQIYDYPLIQTIELPEEKDCFDIAFISNGEPFETQNYKKLQNQIQSKNLKNRLYWIKGVDGRTNAYKKAAEESLTEYFYAVFAKSQVKDSFMFDYTVDRALSKKHRIFYAHLKELGIDYGTFNIDLYNRSLCIDTAEDGILDFTLSQPHEVVPITASETVLSPDNYTAWKNAFREVSKLIYWQHHKPTVETNFRLGKWLSCENEWLRKGAIDGKKFTEEINFSETAILETYSWDFCRNRFKTAYPTEVYY